MVLQKTGSVRLTTLCNRISIVELDALEYAGDAEKDTSTRVQAKIPPGRGVFVILDAVLRIHQHEIRTPLPNISLSGAQFGLSISRPCDARIFILGFLYGKSQKMQPGLFTINLVPFLLAYGPLILALTRPVHVE
jgi:hypothetical protein